MPRSAERNAAEYPPGPDPSTSISHSMSARPLYVAAAGAGAAGAADLAGPAGAADAGAADAGVAGCVAAAAGAAAFAADGDAPASLSSDNNAVPCDTLSPTFTVTAFTTPAAGDGTSIVALSDSSVTSESSALTVSPGLTSTSMTGTSLKSPMSGTFTSTMAI